MKPAVVQPDELLVRRSADDPRNIDQMTVQGQGQTTDNYVALLQFPESILAEKNDVVITPHQQEVSKTPRQQQEEPVQITNVCTSLPLAQELLLRKVGSSLNRVDPYEGTPPGTFLYTFTICLEINQIICSGSTR